MTSSNRFGAQYEMSCSDLGRLLRKKVDALWDDLWVTKNNLWEVHREVPQVNWSEAERRVKFMNAFMKKYNRMLHSSQKVYVLVHQINEKLKKIQANQGQVEMDFMAACQEADEAEIKELMEIKKMIKSLSSKMDYFEEMYWGTRQGGCPFSCLK